MCSLRMSAVTYGRRVKDDNNSRAAANAVMRPRLTSSSKLVNLDAI
jgi:hypothetical protein